MKKKIAENIKIKISDIEYETDIFINKDGNLELGKIPKIPIYTKMYGAEIILSKSSDII